MLLEYYEKLLQLKCFSFDDATKIFGDERKTKNILYTLKKKGLLHSVRRNYYATISLETKEAVATPFEIVVSLYKSPKGFWNITAKNDTGNRPGEDCA